MSARAAERSETTELETPLELIAEMAQDFAASQDVDATLRRGLERIRRHVGAEGGALFLLSEAGDEIVCHASSGPVSITGIRLRTSEGVVGRSVRNNACEMVRDVLNDPNFESSVDKDSGFLTHSILCAPLSVRDRCLGAIELVNKKSGDHLFDESDMRLLRTMASSAALALLNARLAADLVDQERVRRELELAAEIQRSLLPRRIAAPFPVAGTNVPARLISGDFFDFLSLDDGRIAFCLGDVSGKGMNAALLMAKTAGLYRCLVKTAPEPGPLLAALNREIVETAARGMFVTMVGGIYDPGSGRVRMANAGHEPPLLRARDGGFQDFAASAPPLGIDRDLIPREGLPEIQVDLDGGRLYVFSDGVTEARTPEGSSLGVEGLKELLVKAEALPAPEQIDRVVESLVVDPLHDDITLLVVDGLGGRP